MYAQSSGTGAVRGAVTDEQGHAVANAQVTMTNMDTAYSRTVNTDATGNYVFQSLPVGRYTLKIGSAQGFKSFEEKDIVLHVGDNLTYDARLAVGGTNQTVEVEA